MKTSIITFFLMLCLIVSGCSSYSLENDPLIIRANELVAQKQQLDHQCDLLEAEKIAFYATLSDEQLKKIDAYVTSSHKNNAGETMIAFRQMIDVMSKEQIETLFDLFSRFGKALQENLAVTNELTRMRLEAEQRLADLRHQKEVDRSAWGASTQGFSRGFSEAVQMDQQLKSQNQVIYPLNNNNNNSTYWQEERARQEYFEHLQPGLYRTK